MATPLDFIKRVVPWPASTEVGWVNLHWTKSFGAGDARKAHWRGTPYRDPEAFIRRAQDLSTQPSKAEDIYFCTSLQSTTATHSKGFVFAVRQAKHALALKALFLDIDIKDPPKGYPTLTEALAALTDFVKATLLPPPSILVKSGGGLHVYWVSDKRLSADEWLSYARGLKVLTLQHKLRCDPITTDAARVLRVPGTFNRKLSGQPRVVSILYWGPDDYDFSTRFQHLIEVGKSDVTSAVTTKAPFDLSAFAGKKMHPLLAPILAKETDKLSDGLYDDRPLVPNEVIKGCPHFRDAFKNGGATHSQGLWMQTVLASTFFDDGYTWAKQFSQGYPNFNEDELKAMYQRKLADRKREGLGWPSCKAFSDNGCTFCQNCVYNGKITSPLKLAARAAPDPLMAPAVNATPAMADETAVTSEILCLPPGYVLVDQQICLHVPAGKKTEQVFLPIFHGIVTGRPTVAAPTQGYMLYFSYRQGKNYVDVAVPYEVLGTDNEIRRVLSRQGIMVAAAATLLGDFMRSWVAQIEEIQERMNANPLGWQLGNGGEITGFAYGGTLYKSDGTEIDAGVGDLNLRKMYDPTGDAKPIFDAMAILSEQHNPALEVLALQSWTSPLLQFAHLYSAVVWGYSGEGGAHKSSALFTGLAVWGSPKLTKAKPGITAPALEGQLDTIKNLPMCIDEVTDDERIGMIHNVMQAIPEGAQGGRANRDGTRRSDKEWRCGLVVGSNTSMHDYQLRMGATSNARAQRVFEFEVPKKDGARDASTVTPIIDALDKNFGHVGRHYAKYLAMNHEKLALRYAAKAAEVTRTMLQPGALALPGGERYWQAVVAMTLLAAEVANELLEQPIFHYEEIQTFLYATYHTNRAWVEEHVASKGTLASVEDCLAKLFEAFINNTLVTDFMASTGGRPVVSQPVRVLLQPPENSGHGNPIFMQWVLSPPMLRVDIAQAQKVLGGSAKMLDAMMKTYGGKNRKVDMTAGLPLKYAKGRKQVWELPLDEGHPVYPYWKERHDYFTNTANGPISARLAKQDEEKAAANDNNIPAEDVPEILKDGVAQATKDAETVARGLQQ